MSIVAIVPVAQMAAANLSLEEAGFGPRNFSVPYFKTVWGLDNVQPLWAVGNIKKSNKLGVRN